MSLVIWIWSATAFAQERVALIVPTEPTESAARAEERMRAELMSAGYEVVTLSVDGQLDAAAFRGVANRTGAHAAVSLRLQDGMFAGAVWVKDTKSGQESLQHVREAEPTLDGAAMFAIWAAEQLRASEVALETSASPPPAEPEPAPYEPPRPAAPAEPPREPEVDVRPLALSGGVGAIFGPGGVPFGVGPALSLSWRTQRWFVALRFVGPVSSTLRTPTGKVDIDQELMIVRLGADLDLGTEPVVPFVAVGVGAYRIGVRGDAVPPYVSASNQAWSGAFLLSGGVRVHLSEAVFLAAETGAWAASDRPVISIAGASDASVGRPDYTASMDLGLSW